MKNINPKIRVSLYLLLAAGGAVLVTYGVVTQAAYEAIVPAVAGILMVTSGGVAAANTSVGPRTNDPSILEWARMGQDAIPALLEEVQRNRAAAPAPASDSGLPIYDGPTSDVYVGQHRLDPED